MAKSSDGSLLHFGSVRLRVTGSGNLKLYLRSLQNVHNQTLTPQVITPLMNREPVTLSNFIDQRGQLEVKVTEIGEYFLISKIVIFIRPIYSGYSQ